MSESNHSFGENTEEQLFEGKLKSVISTYKRVENSPTTGQLLVPQEHMATLLEGLEKQSDKIENIESQNINIVELQTELDNTRQRLSEYEQREAKDRTRKIEIGRKASEIVALTKEAIDQKPE